MLRTVLIAALTTFLFGLAETGLAIALAFSPSSGYEIPAFLIGTFLAVYGSLWLFARLTQVGVAKLWHALIVYSIGIPVTAAMAFVVSENVAEAFEASMYFFLSGIFIAFVLPFPLLLAYNRLLIARNPVKV